MNLETIAQEAMDYLDKAGVAAEWEVTDYGFRIYIMKWKEFIHSFFIPDIPNNCDKKKEKYIFRRYRTDFMYSIRDLNPIKSPN